MLAISVVLLPRLRGARSYARLPFGACHGGVGAAFVDEEEPSGVEAFYQLAPARPFLLVAL